MAACSAACARHNGHLKLLRRASSGQGQRSAVASERGPGLLQDQPAAARSYGSWRRARRRARTTRAFRERPPRGANGPRRREMARYDAVMAKRPSRARREPATDDARSVPRLGIGRAGPAEAVGPETARSASARQQHGRPLHDASAGSRKPGGGDLDDATHGPSPSSARGRSRRRTETQQTRVPQSGPGPVDHSHEPARARRRLHSRVLRVDATRRSLGEEGLELALARRRSRRSRRRRPTRPRGPPGMGPGGRRARAAPGEVADHIAPAWAPSLRAPAQIDLASAARVAHTSAGPLSVVWALISSTGSARVRSSPFTRRLRSPRQRSTRPLEGNSSVPPEPASRGTVRHTYAPRAGLHPIRAARRAAADGRVSTPSSRSQADFSPAPEASGARVAGSDSDALAAPDCDLICALCDHSALAREAAAGVTRVMGVSRIGSRARTRQRLIVRSSRDHAVETTGAIRKGFRSPHRRHRDRLRTRERSVSESTSGHLQERTSAFG